MEDFGLTQDAVATRVGKDRSTVANSLRLLKLPEILIGDLRKGLLTRGHGKAISGLIGLVDHHKIIELRNLITQKKLSVRETEAEVNRLKSSESDGNKGIKGEGNKKPSLLDDHQWKSLRDQLEKGLNTRVEFKGKKNKGKILIDYYSYDDFNRIIDLISPTTFANMSNRIQE